MEAWCAARMDERIERNVDQPDVSSYLIEWSMKHKRLDRDKHTLYGDAIALVIAGRLAKHPTQLMKLQDELDALDSVEDVKALKKLSHLNGIVNETLRLHPGVPTGGLRQTPASGITISGRFIPGDTVICAPRYSIGRRKQENDRKAHLTAFS
ncbi:MAG: hypothetical protein Q9219_005870 [cf. Caloplaca sp. 3 TL-2023]